MQNLRDYLLCQRQEAQLENTIASYSLIVSNTQLLTPNHPKSWNTQLLSLSQQIYILISKTALFSEVENVLSHSSFTDTLYTPNDSQYSTTLIFEGGITAVHADTLDSIDITFLDTIQQLLCIRADTCLYVFYR